jgi:hypothetical protein
VTTKRERHLDTRLALDFLEQRLEASERGRLLTRAGDRGT